MQKTSHYCSINSLDHEKANFDKTVEMIKERFGNNICLVQFPVSEGSTFNSVIDVIKMKMLRYPKEGGKAELVDIPAEHLDRQMNFIMPSLKKQLKAMRN
jgi:elongation factor G